jgi:uncharacterized membrane protein
MESESSLQVSDSVPVSSSASTGARQRVDAVDLLRGVVMVIMMLDHTRDFFHEDILKFDPTDLTKTSVILFFTRWITHFCAPIFVFLAGSSVFFQLMRGKTKAELSKFLLTRGLWLVVLELTIIRVLIWFNFDFHFVAMLQVIWVIGISMIVLAALIHLPLRVIAVCSIAMIAFHNVLGLIQVPSGMGPDTPAPGFWASVWMVLHQPGIIFLTENVYVFVAYPLIPWVAVLAVGYCFGAIYQWEAERRRRFLFRLGIGLLGGFIVLRGLNLYGDPAPWSVQKNAVFTILSFVNVTKYPPSLLFLLLTIGTAMFALAWFERTESNPVTRIFITFGRVPLFFYMGQWLTAHGLAVLVGYLAGQSIGRLFSNFLESPMPNSGNLGFPLWVVYVAWFAGLLILYPLCHWFAGVKRRRNDWWLSYL